MQSWAPSLFPTAIRRLSDLFRRLLGTSKAPDTQPLPAPVTHTEPLLYQPVFDLITGEVAGLQVHWPADVTGPAQAERLLARLSDDISDPSPSPLGITLSIDLPLQLLTQPALLSRLDALNAQVRLRLWRLEIGFTETQWLGINRMPSDPLAHLHAQGVRLAVNPLLGHPRLWSQFTETPAASVSIVAHSRWNTSLPGSPGRTLRTRAQAMGFEVIVREIKKMPQIPKAVHNGYRLGRGDAMQEAGVWSAELFNKQPINHPIVH